MKYKLIKSVLINLITQLIVINIVPLLELFCNCRSLICSYLILKDISFNAKCLLVWRDQPVTRCLVQAIFGMNCPRDFSQIVLPNVITSTYIISQNANFFIHLYCRKIIYDDFNNFGFITRDVLQTPISDVFALISVVNEY